MKRLPQRGSLIADTAAVLREELADGGWDRWLPGENELAARLHVSRATLRGALAQLEVEGLITASQGRRREITGCRKPTAQPRSRTVTLLIPMPEHQLPASAGFWMDQLRKWLAAEDWQLEIVSRPGVFRRQPGRALADLTASMRAAAWVLYRSNREMQRWFAAADVPCVIAGSRYEGVQLPAVDEDYRSGCRHAAGRLKSVGCKRLAVLRPDMDLAGDRESMDGFGEGAKDTPVTVVSHDSTPAGVRAALDKLLKTAHPPDGLLVFQGSHCLTALGHFLMRSVRVPEDIAVICRDDEPFLSHCVPTPSRYSVPSALFGRKVSRIVMDQLAGRRVEATQHLILPDFQPGETLTRR